MMLVRRMVLCLLVQLLACAPVAAEVATGAATQPAYPIRRFGNLEEPFNPTEYSSIEELYNVCAYLYPQLFGNGAHASWENMGRAELAACRASVILRGCMLGGGRGDMIVAFASEHRFSWLFILRKIFHTTHVEEFYSRYKKHCDRADQKAASPGDFIRNRAAAAFKVMDGKVSACLQELLPAQFFETRKSREESFDMILFLYHWAPAAKISLVAAIEKFMDHLMASDTLDAYFDEHALPFMQALVELDFLRRGDSPEFELAVLRVAATMPDRKALRIIEEVKFRSDHATLFLQNIFSQTRSYVNPLFVVNYLDYLRRRCQAKEDKISLLLEKYHESNYFFSCKLSDKYRAKTILQQLPSEFLYLWFRKQFIGRIKKFKKRQFSKVLAGLRLEQTKAILQLAYRAGRKGDSVFICDAMPKAYFSSLKAYISVAHPSSSGTAFSKTELNAYSRRESAREAQAVHRRAKIRKSAP
ncbi:hypothetical protein PAPHI01_2230 [Pancytospora philotis]|nr:hypothetical protein PAPHI01_2230 [Pancytospora philotis]